MARKLTENPDDMVDTEEEMSSEDLIITSNYSYYDILEEEKGNYYQKRDVWVKTKKTKIGEGDYC